MYGVRVEVPVRERDGRSRDDLYLIAVGQLIGNRGGEDAVPHIVAETIIQYVKSAQYSTFCRLTLGWQACSIVVDERGHGGHGRSGDYPPARSRVSPCR